MHRYSLICLVLVGACGGNADNKKDTAETTSSSDASDTSSGAEVTLPTGCYLPAQPTADMDCDLMCRKVSACGIPEDDCLSGCAEYRYLLAPEAGEKVEACFVEKPCDNHPAALGALGCVALLADDPSYTPPAGNVETCGRLEAKATTCNIQSDVAEQLTLICDAGARGLSSEIMARAAACESKPCDEFIACLDESSCVFRDLAPEDPIPDEKDACVDERDRNEIGTEPVVAQAFACVDGCEDGSFWCAQGCLVDGGDLTGGCATCLTLLARCGRAECDSACADPGSAACVDCLADHCGADFQVCAGRPVPGTEGALVCSDGDRTEIATENVTENVTKCVGQCADGATCNDECMSAVFFVSDECAKCAGDLADCAGHECLQACDDLADVEGCYRCLAATSCFDDFAGCSGFTVLPPKGAGCLRPADVTHAEDGSAWARTVACAVGCVGEAPACLGACVAEQANLTDTCEPCYAAFGTCAKDCLGPCGADAASPECAACIPSSCTEAFVACGGLPPFEPPTPGTATCATTLSCALACSGANAATCVEACIQAAVPAGIPLARRVTTCVRTTCAGQDASCIARECLGDYQQCEGITPELSCQALDACLGACATAACQAECFERAKSDADVDALLAEQACFGLFCEAGDGDCLATVANDIALCGIPVATCQDPDFVAPDFDCGDIAACSARCSTQECADACARGHMTNLESTLAAQYFSCLSNSCSGGGLCYIDTCWDEYTACFGPSSGLTCLQVAMCENACATYSCSARCLGAAADEATALARVTYVQCIVEACTGPDGEILAGCEEAVTADGAKCFDEAVGCFGPP